MAYAKAQMRKLSQRLENVEDTVKRAYDTGKLSGEGYDSLISAGLRDMRLPENNWGEVIVDKEAEVPPATEEAAVSFDHEPPSTDAGVTPPTSPHLPYVATGNSLVPAVSDGEDGQFDGATPAECGMDLVMEFSHPERSEITQECSRSKVGSQEAYASESQSLNVRYNEGSKKIRVSRGVLSAASSVMAQKLQVLPSTVAGKGELFDIDLPSEDLRAMETICNAVHFRSADIPTTQSPTDLVRVGRISKEYQFTEALRPWSMTWIREALKTAQVHELSKLLEAARLLDVWEEYSLVSFDMVRLQVGAFQYRNGLPPDTIAYLEQSRLAMVLRLTEVVEKATSDLMSTSMQEGEQVRLYWAKQVMIYELWPIMAGLCNSSVQGVLEHMETFREPVNMLKAGDPCGCREPALDLQKKFQTCREQVYGEGVGVCMDCVETQGRSAETGGCRLNCGELGRSQQRVRP